MRLSRSLLAELPSRIKPSRSHEYKHPWLRALKRTQLTEIAQVTGIRSAGSKDNLSERLDRELHAWDHDSAGGAENGRNGRHPGSQLASINADKGMMSILSIDMGIRNLAYTHLIVPKTTHQPTPTQQQRGGSDPLPLLNAWRRIDVSRLPTNFPPISASATAEKETTTMTDGSSAPRTLTFLDHISSSPFNSTVAEEEEEEEEEDGNGASNPTLNEDEEFSPLALAPRAYTLVSALLDAYKPTHVLLERQRFRTNRAASVFEWTLRVGVFEGMLYSTFLALARERPGMAPLVVPIEPSRVARYLAQQVQSNPEEEGAVEGPNTGGEKTKKTKTKKEKKKGEETREDEKSLVTPKISKLNSRETKKMKINLVASWLTSASTQPPPSHHLDDPGSESQPSSSPAPPSSPIISIATDHSADSLPQPKLKIGSDELLRRWIDVYLSKRPGVGKGARPRSRSRKEQGPDKRDDVILREVRKLDDLADCLVQGVTWLEWMRNRDRVAREGPDMVVRSDKAKKSRK